MSTAEDYGGQPIGGSTTLVGYFDGPRANFLISTGQYRYAGTTPEGLVLEKTHVRTSRQERPHQAVD